MGLMDYIAVSILFLIILIFAIAKYPKKSKLQTLCKKIAKFLLAAISARIPLTDKDIESLLN